MKRILLGLGLALALCVSYANAQGTQLCYTVNGSSCAPGVQASNSQPINISTATTTKVITANSARATFLTSWDVMNGGTGNLTWVYGSGTNCGTGTTAMTGPYPLIAQAGISKGVGVGPVLFAPKAKDVCIITDANVQHSGSFSYVQF